MSPEAILAASPREAQTVNVVRTSFIAATKLVDKLGQIKAEGEALACIAIAVRATQKILKMEARLSALMQNVDLAAYDAAIANLADLYREARIVYGASRDDVEAQRSKHSERAAASKLCPHDRSVSRRSSWGAAMHGKRMQSKAWHP